MDQDQLNLYLAYEGYVDRVPHNPHLLSPHATQKLSALRRVDIWLTQTSSLPSKTFGVVNEGRNSLCPN